MMALIGHILEEGAYFRRKQIGGGGTGGSGAVSKSTPGAIGNREMSSGEFLGIMLFIGNFSRSARRV